MNADYGRYKGFYPYKMDSKYRVSVLASWRPEAGAPLFLMFSKKLGMPIVKVLSQEAYNAKVTLVLESDKLPAQKAEILEKLAMLCREATLNEQGKLLIPKDLSEEAGITADADVILAGRGIHFEVWNKPNFARYLSSQTEDDATDDLKIF